MTRPAATVALLFLASLTAGAGRLRAQFPIEIASVHPGLHARIDALTTPVTVTFAVDGSFGTRNDFRVYGDQTGLYVGNVTIDPEARTITFTHDEPFKAGERLTAVLTNRIIAGNPGGFSWTFEASPSRGTGFPSDSILVLGDLTRPVSVAAGDLDDDGFLDLAAADMSADAITLYRGNCRSLTRMGSIPTGIGPNRIITVDVNADGLLDLLVAHYFERAVSVHMNLGNGEFSGPTRRVDVSPVNPVGIATAEFSGDDRLDAIVWGGNSVGLLVNAGGGFLSMTDVLTTPGPPPLPTDAVPLPSNVTIALGDIDNDGYADLFAGIGNHSLIRRFHHGRDLPFFREDTTGAIRLPDQPIQLDLLGLHSSDSLDLVVATEGFPGQHLLTYWNDGTGGIPPVIRQDLSGLDLPAAFDLLAVDLDAAIDPDAHDLDLLINHPTDRRLLFFRNDGGTLAPQPDIETGVDPQHFARGDFNLDGAIDLAVPNAQDNTIWVYLSAGSADWNLTLDPDPIDFGAVSRCSAPTRTLLVRNENPFLVGIDTLLLETGTAFRIIDPAVPPDKILAGDSLSITIEYRPGGLGSEADRLHIVTERCMTLDQAVDLSAEGLFPFDVSPDTVAFPETAVGAVSERIVMLSNPFPEGDVEVVASLAGAAGPFAISESPCGDPPVSEVRARIEAGATLGLCVTFRPEERLAFVDTLMIAPPADGPCDFPERRVPLSGAGSVNDPPFFVGVPDSAALIYVEGDGVFIALTALDPESDLLDMTLDSVVTPIPLDPVPVLSGVGSPCGEFTACGDLAWTAPDLPDDVDAMTFAIFFTVRERDTPERLAGTLRLPVTSARRLPDLFVVSLTTPDAAVVPNRPVPVTASVGLANGEIPPGTPSFTFRVRSDTGEERVYTIDRITPGGVETFRDAFLFPARGDHWVEAVVDEEGAIAESNEENNRAVLPLRVERGGLIVRHSPFTPNHDGFNDRVEFDLTELDLDDPVVYLFAIDGRRVATLRDVEGARIYWDGTGSGGGAEPPGAYLFVLRDGGEGIESGTIGLAR